ncbi:TIGR02099 family protein [Modicisalibacter muralis]|uniref:TIGR02099 family protein n=1 Tax=Modicisalibacter muralis TaxID=119000 RepID=A0A1G9LEM0_9GAMM|nr:YhdP family protein [Halomonas muralis]SDL59955.1 TIGR02099 family protein [Halomonas muralis]
MSPFRIVLRWALTLLAIGLTLLALLLGGLRLAASQADILRDDLSAMLARQFNATLRVEAIESGIRGLDPVLAIDGLHLTGQAGIDSVPLLDVEQVDLRLDASASLRAWFPIFSRARVSHATLHLYQKSDGGWHWPQPAELPPELVPESRFNLKRLDFWIGVLLRQRAVVDDLRLVLHGVDGSVTLVAPRLLMVGAPERARIEGQVFVEGVDERALQAVLEVVPGSGGADDFNARLQASINLDSLARLSRLLTEQSPVRVTGLSGEAEVWGNWQAGQLADARARLAIGEMTLTSDAGPLVLNDIGAKGQWLRDEQGAWRAWVNELALHSEAIPTSPLPQRLYLEGDAQGWQARSTSIELGVVTAWAQQLPLPESLSRTLGTLAPQGLISGLAVGRQHGQWLAKAALQDVAVSPWQGIPGGGPLDGWVEAQGREGHVRFVGRPGMQLAFPELYAAPMALDWASGKVSWALDGGSDAFSVTGERLKAVWRGARVDGDFHYASTNSHSSDVASTGDSASGDSGKLELNLDMRDVDAIDTPLMEWLPVDILDAELREWLAGGIAGRVPHGTLHLEQTLDDDDDTDESDNTGQPASKTDTDEFDGELRLALDVEDGKLTYDPEWPALENVSGRLELVNETLHATVDHAETLGLVSEGTRVALEDERLSVTGPVQGPTQGLFRFLAEAPIEGMDAFARWRSEGRVIGELALDVPMENPEALEVDVQASVDAPSLTFSEIDLTLGNVNGALHYRHAKNTDFLTGELGARAFEGPLLARFDVGGEGIAFEGRALARGLLQWAGMAQLDGLLSGYFPYSAQLDLKGEEPHLSVESDLQGLAILLPPPFGKRLDEGVALHVEATPGQRLTVDLADRLRLRWRSLGPAPGQGQGQIWLERWPASAQWPGDQGWNVIWRTPRLYLGRWQSALAALGETPSDDAPASVASGPVAQPGTALPSLRRIVIDTGCLHFDERCLGSLEASASPLADGWRLDLAGTLMQGQASYRPNQTTPLSIDLTRLNLDTLMPQPTQMPELSEAIATAPEPKPLPGWLDKVPSGDITIDTILRQGRRLGPLSASWQASPQRLRVAPLSLTLGEVTAAGELVWEASGPEASLTRSRLALTGGDLGSALKALGQPVAIRSARTQVESQLAWPGAPWQFALERSRGSIEVALEDGRFVTLDSPSARLIGLLNVDNLLRRLRLDFSDVTGEGTAFDSVRGSATLYGGRLQTRGPVEIDGPSTQFTLEGGVDLAARRLDMLLGITVPVSQNLPLAAVLVGAPYVGGALFLADKIFGGWLDKVTRIHYRVQGPWTSPQITLENAE